MDAHVVIPVPKSPAFACCKLERKRVLTETHLFNYNSRIIRCSIDMAESCNRSGVIKENCRHVLKPVGWGYKYPEAFWLAVER